MQHGATPEEWAYFDLMLGLTEDLLPVVSNPRATISPNSSLKTLGKTPSIYNNEGYAVGLAKWTERRTNGRDVTRWQRQADYGICVQTRHLRAIDVDIEQGDEAALVRDKLTYILGVSPIRLRSNSAKFLIPVFVPGTFGKRVIKTTHGIVEFLANGQQFVAAGEHSSGVRYEWQDTDKQIPTLTEAQFADIVRELQLLVGVADVVAGNARRVAGEMLTCDDPTAQFLRDHNLVLGEGNEGQLYIQCPWISNHTTSSGDSETSYLLRGTRGYERGHFSCLHAGCASRTDADFETALGVAEADFEVIGEEPLQAVARPLLPKFERRTTPSGKSKITNVLNNVIAALGRPDVCRWHIGRDLFKEDVMIAPENTTAWRSITDEDYISLRSFLEANGFDPVGREMIRDACLSVAASNPFDSAQMWLDGLRWDGVERVPTFLSSCLGVADSDYARSVACYMWTALAGRIIEPGCQADMVPILVGAQGVGKSSVVRAICPNESAFVRLKLDAREDDLSRMMRGRCVAELAELQGLHTRELEGIKAFIDKREEQWVPKFQERAITYKRRLLFIGTTNQEEFLADNTGNRRWLPAVCAWVDLAYAKLWRDQLWAEGAARFLAGGIEWQEAHTLGVGAHGNHEMSDSWVDIIRDWLHAPDGLDGNATPATRDFLHVHDVLIGALGYEAKHIKRFDQMRAGDALAKNGYIKGQRWSNGRNCKVWVATRK